MQSRAEKKWHRSKRKPCPKRYSVNGTIGILKPGIWSLRFRNGDESEAYSDVLFFPSQKKYGATVHFRDRYNTSRDQIETRLNSKQPSIAFFFID